MAQLETLSPVVADKKERKIVFLFCLLAAVHVFIFSAAFPFFNNVDEPLHFDLVVKYSQGHIPHTLELVSPESAQFLAFYSSMAYLGKSDFFPNHQFPPPPWTQPLETVRQNLLGDEAAWQRQINYESSQPPLYYTMAGGYWRLGRVCGFPDGFLLYGLRFLNIFLVAALVWLGYCAARLIFPENLFLRLSVPALLAFIPQTAFYSIDNDVLSPLCFGAAFICLVHLLRAQVPTVRLTIATGLALAATLLTKMTNLPLILVSMGAVLFKIWSLWKTGKLRIALPPITLLVLIAGLIAGGWMAWTKYNFGDFTGASVKGKHLGWTLKPFSEWWHHPIFTPRGTWTFLSHLLATFWRGEFWWHLRPLSLPWADLIYAISSLGLVALALVNFHFTERNHQSISRQALWLAFWSFSVTVAFFGFSSIIYDFGNCPNPSREYPYFVSGRLMLGTLIPFVLLFLYGFDCALKMIKNKWTKPLILAGMILSMLVLETVIDWPVFSNPYNWFHI